MHELSAAFTGGNVAKLSVQPQNPDGSGPLIVTVEFADGGSLAVVTERPIHAVVPGRDGSPSRPMIFTPILVGRRAVSRPAR